MKKKKKTPKKRKKIESKKIAKQNIFKSNEEKVKITKVKKQPTEKRIYNINDYVVYPKHGVGKIVSVDKAKIGGINISFYKKRIKRNI